MVMIPSRFRPMLMLLIAVWVLPSMRPALATDYFLTIGGGYDPAGNQASLEANVIFFQQVLSEKHRTPRRHQIYFSDGNAQEADLQVLVEKPAQSTTPATDLLASLHRRPGELDVTYRNHRVQEISGPLDPKLIRESLDQWSKAVQSGDRLIVYVTAHGSEGPKEDQFNTTIDCWNDRKITAREFTGWLNKLPQNVPVVMVMAQCYCGGFGRTIFQDLDQGKGLDAHPRVGFFAQQHNLPAAGCRPDIEHDEEFSSYFWGALAGRSRNGVPIKDCDIDGNGAVSFAEAYAYAVTAGETIDIPIRTSEVLLRTYSRLKPEQSETARTDVPPSDEPVEKKPDQPVLATMSGTLQSFVDRSRPVTGRIVKQLAATLGFKLEDDVQSVLTAQEDHRRAGRSQQRRQPNRRGGRRELLREIAEKWPDLADPRRWRESKLLNADNQEKLAAELQELPGWKGFEERQKQREKASKEAEKHELRAVKFRRLTNTLEVIVLEQNLPLVAKPDIVDRYKQMVNLEESTLAPGRLK